MFTLSSSGRGRGEGGFSPFFHTFPFYKGEKEKSSIENIQKSSPPFERERTGGISEPPISKN